MLIDTQGREVATGAMRLASDRGADWWDAQASGTAPASCPLRRGALVVALSTSVTPSDEVQTAPGSAEAVAGQDGAAVAAEREVG